MSEEKELLELAESEVFGKDLTEQPEEVAEAKGEESETVEVTAVEENAAKGSAQTDGDEVELTPKASPALYAEADGDTAEQDATSEENSPSLPTTEHKKFLFLYIAIGCFALGVISFGLAVGLSFVVQGVGIYLLLTSMISELCCMSFINAQKKMQKTNLCLIFTILSYVVLFAGVILIVTGTIAVTSCQGS